MDVERIDKVFVVGQGLIYPVDPKLLLREGYALPEPEEVVKSWTSNDVHRALRNTIEDGVVRLCEPYNMKWNRELIVPAQAIQPVPEPDVLRDLTERSQFVEDIV